MTGFRRLLLGPLKNLPPAQGGGKRKLFNFEEFRVDLSSFFEIEEFGFTPLSGGGGKLFKRQNRSSDNLFKTHDQNSPD